MFRLFFRQLKPALAMLVWMTLLTGLAYPLAMTGLGQALFPVQANGSLLPGADRPAGSALIGQPFAADRYFWPRPSATAPQAYNAAASSGSNLGPSNPALAEAVAGRAARLGAANGDGPAPMDLVTASASGLDPDISPAAARYQIARVAGVRGLAPETVAALVEAATKGRLWGFWGEPRVNVLTLNLALDAAGRRE